MSRLLVGLVTWCWATSDVPTAGPRTHTPSHRGGVPRPIAGAFVSLVCVAAAIFGGPCERRAEAGEIGYLETFALAPDRSAVLEQLLPGTEEYYYYHCLHGLQTENYADVQRLLREWTARYGRTADVQRIEIRHALLTYPATPRQTLDFLRRELGPNLQHPAPTRDPGAKIPTVLDETGFSRDKRLADVLKHWSTLSDIEDSALVDLVGRELDPLKRHQLLERLTRPDVPGLVQVVADDLAWEQSGPFGSLALHRQLLQSQLVELAALRPDLINQTAYVQARIAKLAPSDDENATQNRDVRRAYLTRLWDYVQTLNDAHNSLKAHVLYHRLQFDREDGVHDRERFDQYLRLPRYAPYLTNEAFRPETLRRTAVDLNADYASLTGLPPVRNDESLVRAYLSRFFQEDANWDRYADVLLDSYAKRLFAEVKLTGGLGDAASWTRQLSPDHYRQLHERVELEFLPTNSLIVQDDERIALDLTIKNVKNLVVKIYKVNTASCYRHVGREINTDLALDGLAPNQELTFCYAQPSILRHEEHFEFPGLDERGVYLIDFIGGGQSSRALVRRGQLIPLVKTTAAGQVVTVVTGSGQAVPTAQILIGGREFTAHRETGEILIPFTTEPGPTPVVVLDGDFASRATIVRDAETYSLRAGFYTPRESLVAGAMADLLIRPTVTVAGQPISPGVLTDVRLRLESEDWDETGTTQEIRDLPLFEDRETLHRFRVPERLTSLTATLTASIRSLTSGEIQAVSDSHKFHLDRGEGIEDAYLSRVALPAPDRRPANRAAANEPPQDQPDPDKGNANEPEADEDQADEGETAQRPGVHDAKPGSATSPRSLQRWERPAPSAYVVTILGRSGEPIADRVVNFELKHRDFVQSHHVTLKTSASGQIVLGSLPGIQALEITSTGLSHLRRRWPLTEDRVELAPVRHARVGETILIPDFRSVVPDSAEPPRRPDPKDISLLELRGETFVADRFEHVTVRPGYLAVEGLPPGDYDLAWRRENRSVRLRVTDGPAVAGHLAGRSRLLEATTDPPLSIDSLQIVAREPDHAPDVSPDAAGQVRPEHAIPRSDSKPEASAAEGAADAKPDEDPSDAEAESDRDGDSPEPVLVIGVANAHPAARVHVIASPLVPAFDPLTLWADGSPKWPSRLTLARPESRYLSGRDIGDEYRYVIDRRGLKTYPGNMLARPGLLLDPWAIRETTTETQLAQAGENFAPSSEAPESQMDRDGAAAKVSPGFVDHANLEWLGQPATVLTNLVPDDEGLVIVPVSDLGVGTVITVVAVQPGQTVVRTLVRPNLSIPTRDRTLTVGFEPQSHLTQIRRTSVLTAGETFRLADVTTSRAQIFTSVGDVYRYFVGRESDKRLNEFEFVTRWSKLSREQKQELYSKYACHELNVFLFFKDEAFFRAVVRPYLSNKIERRFLDQWLLAEDLRRYTRPWEHGGLNLAETILLARRIDGDVEAMRTLVNDRYDLLVPNPHNQRGYFEAALTTGGLDTETTLGLSEHRAGLESLRQAIHAVEIDGFATASLYDPAPPSLGQEAHGGMGMGGMGGMSLGRVASPSPRQVAPGDPFGTRDAPAAQARLQSAADSLRKNAVNEPASVDGIASRREAEDLVPRRLSDQRRQSGEAAKSYFRESELKERGSARAFYRPIDPTREYLENHYYQRLVAEQNSSLVTVNGFWRDFAFADPEQPFVSARFVEAFRNLPEMMLALAVLDLPFEAEPPKVAFDGTSMMLTATGPTIIFHEQAVSTDPPEATTDLFMSQSVESLTRADSTGRIIPPQFPKEFVRGEVYRSVIRIGNPTEEERSVTVMAQIPVGSVPVNRCRATMSGELWLEPLETESFELAFYFPKAGTFAQFPAHVTEGETLVAAAQPQTFVVVDRPSLADTSSWEHVADFGRDEEVIEALKTRNLADLDLPRIAFRMRDKTFFDRATAVLSARHVYDNVLWAYAILHDHPARLEEYLEHQEAFLARAGVSLVSPIVTIDPARRDWYQLRDFRPLVNARSHRLGKNPTILNDRFSEQYTKFLTILSQKRTLSDDDYLELTHAMLLQDRMTEAFDAFSRVNSRRIRSRIQYDYLAAYLAMSRADLDAAGEIAKSYISYPVDKWRERFVSLQNQIDEILGRERSGLVDPEDRAATQEQLAASEPTFSVRIEGSQIVLDHQNLREVEVRFYPMDVELLFSLSPFVRDYGQSFAYIGPAGRETITLAKGDSTTYDLPRPWASANVLVEVVAAGRSEIRPSFTAGLTVQVVETFGELRVTDRAKGTAVPGAYVKVYSRDTSGSVTFHKDGYTDLRGRFDYASISTGSLETIDRLAILVVTEEQGAVVRETPPPTR